MQILIPGMSAPGPYEAVRREDIGTIGAHEYGHTVGLNHQKRGTNESIRGVPVGSDNLMRFTNREGAQQGGVNSQQLKVLSNTVSSFNQIRYHKQRINMNPRHPLFGVKK